MKIVGSREARILEERLRDIESKLEKHEKQVKELYNEFGKLKKHVNDIEEAEHERTKKASQEQ